MPRSRRGRSCSGPSTSRRRPRHCEGWPAQGERAEHDARMGGLIQAEKMAHMRADEALDQATMRLLGAPWKFAYGHAIEMVTGFTALTVAAWPTTSR